MKLGVLTLKLSDLFELLIKFFVEGMQDGGLECQGATSYSEYADWEHSLEEEHFPFCLTMLSKFNYSTTRKYYYVL